MIAVTFKGAARTTTGSAHLVEANGKRILLDCGLYQGHRKEAFERNRTFDIDPKSIDAVVLSHAHIDHSGNLPTLARRGYSGPVITTPATAELADFMLRDSAFLQSQDLEFVNKKRAAAGQNLFEPLYDANDVSRIISQFRPEELYREVDLGNGVAVVLHEAGHILGSAIVELRIVDPASKHEYHLVFTGDLGNGGQPIIRDPEVVKDADWILIESTYADRLHPPREDVQGRLKSFIDDIHQQRSKLVIPAFSVGRTQEILYRLNELVKAKRIPRTAIYLDSPMAQKATSVYERRKEYYDEGAIELLHEGIDPLKFPGLEFTRTTDESKALNQIRGPMVIISASGMCEGGRIVHHLRNCLPDPRNIVLIVGYQAANTLGRKIVERPESVKIFGEEVPVEARIHTINALSAHADSRGLLQWFDGAKSPRLKRVFAVHGEEPQTLTMARNLMLHGAPRAEAPRQNEKVILKE